MGQVRMHAHVEAPVERVFDYAVDQNRWAEWNVSTVDVEAGGPLTAVGERFAGKNKFLGRVEPFTGEVIAFERPRSFAFKTSPQSGGHENWTARFEPSGTGTDIDCVIDYEVGMGVLGAAADKLFIERQVQRMLDQSRDNFISLMEHEVLVPA
ncbi:MAG TPA: SRPBCC family protein [Candidatus Limnocylindrales bacterium]|nr:SRPBCC family protein [Candidatus Limnocylindrales bacterium]